MIYTPEKGELGEAGVVPVSGCREFGGGTGSGWKARSLGGH